jgi:hypothetical protein
MRVLYAVLIYGLALTAAALAAPTAAPSTVPSPAASSAPSGADSIKILDCSLEFNPFSGVAAKMHVDFINLNALPVTHMRFRVHAGFATFAVMDIGSFAPNLRIHHDLDPPAETLLKHASARTLPREMGGLVCGIDAYTLTDGYTWISPELQSELQKQQQKSP